MVETHPEKRFIGYARVSTYGQTLDAQLEQLRGAGCSKIYREKSPVLCSKRHRCGLATPQPHHRRRDGTM